MSLHGHSRACALQLLRDLNVPLPNGGKPGRPRAFTTAQEVNILSRIAGGETHTAIAHNLRVHRDTITRVVRRAKRVSLETNTTLEST